MTTFISRFTPSLMKHEDLEAIFVQREPLASRIVELIKDSIITPAKHHILLIGPRGIGKTHLVAIAYHRIKEMADGQDKMLIAWLREEEWGVTSFLDLLMRIFRALLDEYNDQILKDQVESLYGLSPDVAERRAEILLKDYVKDRTLFLIVENLGDLFDSFGDEGQKRLRSYLQENPFSTILATSQSLFNGISLQTSPFYGFFNIYHLEELDLENAVELLKKIAHLNGDQELESFIETPTGKSRIRAVHHLAGGSNRVYVIFSQFINRETLDELVESVMKTLDDLTPYYQARMMYLSPQQRKIAEFLCDRRGAINVKEIAERCFLSHQVASAQLKALKDMGYVRPDTVGRESFYELREPLMRLCSEVKKQRGEPIRLLVDFLRIWFSRPELERKLSMIGADATLEREYLLKALQLAKEESEDPIISACLSDFSAYLGKKDYLHALEVTDELIAIRDDSQDWEARGICFTILSQLSEALSCFEKAIEMNPKDADNWQIKGIILMVLKRFNEAYDSFNKAIELRQTGPYIFFNRAEAMLAIDRWDDGIKALEDALIRFAHAEYPNTGDTVLMLNNLFESTLDRDIWQDRVTRLINLYSKHNVLSLLGQGLVESIPRIYSSKMVSDTAIQAWLDVWQRVGGNYPELQIPLRLLDSAVRYRKSKDKRVLLELPVEEREILKPLLGIKDKE